MGSLPKCGGRVGWWVVGRLGGLRILIKTWDLSEKHINTIAD